MILFLKNLLFTLVVPGFVAGWVPLRWLEPRAAWPERLGWGHAAGLAMFAVGLALYLHCVWRFAADGRGTPAPIDAPRRLVVRGLYRWVRNPMYLGVLAVLAGEALFLGSGAVGLWLAAVAVWFHAFTVLHEEPTLRRRFGADYEDYRRRVPRWIPRRPRE